MINFNGALNIFVFTFVYYVCTLHMHDFIQKTFIGIDYNIFIKFLLINMCHEYWHTENSRGPYTIDRVSLYLLLFFLVFLECRLFVSSNRAMNN